MALPFIILGVAAGAAAFGGKKLTMDIKKVRSRGCARKSKRALRGA